MNKVSGQEVRLAMMSKDIISVDHHACSICGVMTRFTRNGSKLFFNSGCGCAWSPPREEDWYEAADWINMQSSLEIRNDLRRRFGLSEEPK